MTVPYILIVEDSPTQALVLKNYLEEGGYKSSYAKDGKEAIDKLNEHIPDIVISDIQMPNMNGYDLCLYIKNNKKFQNIPVMLLTSLSDPLDVIHGIQCGANNFLTKPYKKDLLFFHIHNILDNLKLRSEGTEAKHEFFFGGNLYHIPMNPVQITDLLLSTYSSAIEKNTELNVANNELNLLNQQKNQFLGMAAHDLRNPLGVIQGYSSLLKEALEGKEDADVIDMLTRIEKSSSSMLTLINELLDISVIESGHLKLNLKKQDIVAAVKENVFLNQRLADKKKINLNFTAQENIPLIYFDAPKIDEVFNNLISNALKFSKPETVVTISLIANPKEVILSIKDQGLGIPKAEQEKLFDFFSKLSVKSTAGESSTGLGLAIVKKIISEHHGRIWVESEVNKGSTFHVTLPL